MQSPAERARAAGLTIVGRRPTMASYLGSLWSRRPFVWTYARARTQAGYRGRRLGPLWELLDPLVTMATYWLLFGVLLGARASVPNYLAFLAVGVFTFAIIRRSIQTGSRTIATNRGLLSSLPIPAAILPTAAVVQQVRAFLFSLPVLILVLLVSGESASWTWLLAPAALALIVPFAWGSALLIARWVSHTSDVGGLLPLVLRLWGLASGVMFPVAERAAQLNAPTWLEGLLIYNPGAVYLAVMRDAFLPDYVSPGGMTNWIAAAMWAVAMLTIGLVVFWRGEGTYGRD